MKITKLPFGKTKEGETVDLFILSNNSGASVKITNYGGIITDIIVPDKKNQLGNVVMGFDKIEDYFSEAYKKSRPYFGAIIGRYANRIYKGQFTIKGIKYQVSQNLDSIAQHGGFVGFDKKVWNAAMGKSKDEVSLLLSYTSPHLEEGFPGNLDIEVKYTWNNLNELIMDSSAKSDKSTHLNITNHTYFNLNGFNGDILGHEVIIHADQYTEVDDRSIPTGNLSNVDGSCMDFRMPHKIGARIDLAEGNGYDHNYVIKDFDNTLRLSATVTAPESGRKLEVLTTEPGVQFYTANYLDGSLSRGSVIFNKRHGFCLETQHFPDSPNQPGFPSTLLKPGEKFQSRTIFKFGIRQE
jgi:aldose 1-epimerase